MTSSRLCVREAATGVSSRGNLARKFGKTKKKGKKKANWAVKVRFTGISGPGSRTYRLGLPLLMRELFRRLGSHVSRRLPKAHTSFDSRGGEDGDKLKDIQRRQKEAKRRMDFSLSITVISL